MTGLRIGMIAPPWYRVPPAGYGGIELVVHLLTRELRRLGHEVVLFAAEGSGHEALELAPAGWGEDLGGPRHLLRQATYLNRVRARIKLIDLDVVHDHNEATGIVAVPATSSGPYLATIHSSLSEPYLTFFEGVDPDAVGLIAISAAQAAQAPGLSWRGVVHNAADIDCLLPSAEKGGYLVELARICPDKAQHLAIEVAGELGKPLVLAGKIEETPESHRYFKERIEPHLGDRVRWIPDIGGRDKAELLARADAMLFPIQWEEPFGVAMAEAMASGTPVVALRRGAAPEVVEEGVTGFLADTPSEMVAAGRRIHEIDTRRCAERARERFSPARMAAGYLAIYRQEIERAAH